MSYLNRIKQGKILTHKTLGEGFVSKISKGPSGEVSMLIDFDDGMGRRNIMVADQSDFDKFFKNEDIK